METSRFGGPSFLRFTPLNSFPHSLRSLLDFLWLHLQQAATTLSQLWVPPLCRKQNQCFACETAEHALEE